MKKLFLFLFLATAAFTLPTLTDSGQAKAQLVKTLRPTTLKDSLVNADTLLIVTTPENNHVSGIHVIGTRATGTVAGKVYLQASNDAVNWKSVDSVTLSNTSYVFASFATPNALPYSRYRCQYVSSGTVKVTGIRAQIVTRTR